MLVRKDSEQGSQAGPVAESHVDLLTLRFTQSVHQLAKGLRESAVEDAEQQSQTTGQRMLDNAKTEAEEIMQAAKQRAQQAEQETQAATLRAQQAEQEAQAAKQSMLDSAKTEAKEIVQAATQKAQQAEQDAQAAKQTAQQAKQDAQAAAQIMLDDAKTAAQSVLNNTKTVALSMLADAKIATGDMVRVATQGINDLDTKVGATAFDITKRINEQLTSSMAEGEDMLSKPVD